MSLLILAIVALSYVSAVQNEDSRTVHLFKNTNSDTSKCIGECSYNHRHTILPHEDCNQFCKCTLGHLKVKKCPKNKHYSTESKHCELPKIAKCEKRIGCVGTCPEKDWPQVVHVLPHTDCKKFCKCQNGTALIIDCSYDFKFNIDHGICYPLNETNCISDANTTTTTTTPPTTTTSSTTPSTTTTSSTTPSTTTTSSTTPKFENSCIGSCPSDSDDLYYLPHHDDCTKYCICIDSNPMEQQCKNNLHFSTDLNICVTPAEANCASDTTTSTTPSSTTTTSSTTPKIENSCIGSCPSNSNDLIYLPHSDCTKYCICIDIKPMELQCKNNEHFSTELNVCVTPAEANCASSTTPSPPTSSTTQSTTNTSSTTPKYEYACIGSCPKNSNDLIYLAHGDCTKYCLCIDNKPKEMQCKDNQHFSIDINECLTPAEADCTYQPSFT